MAQAKFCRLGIDLSSTSYEKIIMDSVLADVLLDDGSWGLEEADGAVGTSASNLASGSTPENAGKAPPSLS